MLNSTLNNLKNSPIYNLSMCSLENFHTCFLKWIGQNYPQQIIKVLLNKNVSNNTQINFETQVRYSKDVILDLQITIDDGQDREFIIVENKLKSYPIQEQLMKYQDCFKGKKATFILLSLAPRFDLPDSWKYFSYENLTEKLSQISDFKNQYDELLIKDYIEVVKSISSAFPKNFTQKYDFYEENELDKIGLKDIYVKYRTSELANYIKQNLNQDDWYVGYSFHNKKGTIDIVKNFDISGIRVGIQIENNQYRYFMNIPSDTTEIREKIALNIFTQGYWFYPTQEPVKPRIYKKFCGSEPNFIYRYFELEKGFGKNELSEISYEKIFEQIKKDIENVDKNEISILKIIVNIDMQATNQALEEAGIEPLEF